MVGVAIATQIPDPVPAGIAALTAHFVMDAIPHADYIDVPKLTPANLALVAADGVVALTLLFTLIDAHLWAYALGIGIVATLPDLIEAPKYLFPHWAENAWFKKFSHWHGIVLQYKRELPFPKRSWQYWFWGLLPQAILVGAVIYLII